MGYQRRVHGENKNMKNMLSGKLLSILFVSFCLFNVQTLTLKNRNPMGLKGAPLIEFVENLHMGLEFFENTEAAKWVFDQVADKRTKMSRDGMKNFLTKAAGMMGNGSVPKWVIDRFYGEAGKDLKGEISFSSFQNEMIFAMKRDIKQFTADILKENPAWKYIELRN